MTSPSLVRERWLVTGLAALHFVASASLLPGGMFMKYPDAAKKLLGGALGGAAGGDYSALYLVLHALLSPSSVRVLQSALGALLIVLVHAVAKSLWNARTAMLAAVLASLAAPLLLYEVTFEPEVLVAFLHAFALFGAVRFIGERSFRNAALLGVPLGLSWAARPSNALAAVAVFLWVALTLRGLAEKSEWPRLALGAALTVFLGAGIPRAVTAYAGGEGAAMSPGAVFHMGNNPASTGVGAQAVYVLKMMERQQGTYAAHALYRDFAKASLPEGSAQGLESFWFQKSFAFMATHPFAWVQLEVRKALAFVFGRDAQDLLEVRMAEASLRRFPWLWFETLGLLAFAGACLSLWRGRNFGLPLAFVGSLAAASVAFYVMTRYRLAALPGFVLLAAFGLDSLWTAVKARHVADAGRFVAVCIVGVLLGHSSPVLLDAERMVTRASKDPSVSARLAEAQERGDVAAAQALFRQLMAAQPFVAEVVDARLVPFDSPDFLLATAEEAKATFGESAAIDKLQVAAFLVRAGTCPTEPPTSARSVVYDRVLDGHLLAAGCALDEGRFADALDASLASLALTPGTLDGLSAAVAASLAAGDGRAQALRSELEALHDAVSVHFTLSQWLLRAGATDAAAPEIAWLRKKVPTFGPIGYLAFLLEAQKGNRPRALKALDFALKQFPGFPYPLASIRARLVQWQSEEPSNSDLSRILSDVQRRLGQSP